VIQDKQEWNTRETGVLSCAEQQMVPYRCNALYSIRSTMIQRCLSCLKANAVKKLTGRTEVGRISHLRLRGGTTTYSILPH